MPPRRVGLRLLSMLSLTLVFLALTGCNQQAEGLAQDVDVDYMIGAGLYSRHCAGCHGDSGQGRETLGREINSADWQDSISDDEIRAAILEGRTVPATRMDSFREMLTDDEITAVIVYIRSLRQ